MRGHLTDAQMTEALGGAPGADVLDHLAGCPACRAERDRLQATLGRLAEEAEAQSARPEADWDRQARRIMARREERPPRVRAWRWAWAPALVSLAALVGIWIHGAGPRVSPPGESDDALLASVERSIRADVPAALRPAALLLGEVEDGKAERSPDGQGG